MALSGSVVVRATTQNNLIFSWAASQDAARNVSTISWQLKLEALQYGYINATPGSPWTVTVDGQIFTGTTSIAIGNNETKVLAEGSLELNHNSLGERSFEFTFSQEFWITFDGESIRIVSGQGSAVLDTIPRASKPTVSVQSVEMGSAVTIYTNRLAAFTHALTYSFGGVSGVIAQDVGDSCVWYPPMELAAQIPSTLAATAVITCTTYANGSPVGSNEVSVTLTIPESVVPSAEAVWSDDSGAYGMMDVYVKNVSRLAVTVRGIGAHGSSITGAAIMLNGKNFGGGIVTEAGALPLVVTVTDSRGRIGTKAYTINVADYAAPTVNISASRCDGNGNPDDNGDRAKITVSGYVTQVNGRNRSVLTLNWGSGSEVKEFALGSYSYQKTINANVDETVSITAVISDRLVEKSNAMVLSTGYATLDLLAGGKGISFGKAATREGFECAMPAFFTGGVSGITAADVGAAPNTCATASVTTSYHNIFFVKLGKLVVCTILPAADRSSHLYEQSISIPEGFAPKSGISFPIYSALNAAQGGNGMVSLGAYADGTLRYSTAQGIYVEELVGTYCWEASG